MAATLAQDATLAADAAFIARVKAAMMRRIMALLGTNLTSDQLALARAIIYDPDQYAPLIARGVVTEAAIIARDGVQTNVTDTEISAAVLGVIARYVR